MSSPICPRSVPFSRRRSQESHRFAVVVHQLVQRPVPEPAVRRPEQPDASHGAEAGGQHAAHPALEGSVLPVEPEHAAAGSGVRANAGTARAAGSADQAGRGDSTREEPGRLGTEWIARAGHRADDLAAGALRGSARVVLLFLLCFQKRNCLTTGFASGRND